MLTVLYRAKLINNLIMKQTYYSTFYIQKYDIYKSKQNAIRVYLNLTVMSNFTKVRVHCIVDTNAVWPDVAIYWTLGYFLKPLAKINLPKSLTFIGNFCKGVEMYHFSIEIIFRQLLIDIWQYFSGHTARM